MKISIIVGRFQIPELHEGHIKLINEAKKNSDKLILFLGSRIVRSTKDPLSFKMRKNVVQKYLRLNDEIYEIKDHKSDSVWRERFYNRVKELTNEEDVCTYYGSRDSFLDYLPKNENTVLVEDAGFSGTKIRNNIKNLDNKTFRAGYIKAINDEFNAHYTVVDAIITDGTHVLLGKKDTGYCLIGGFADECDNSLEEAIIREVKEETNLNISNPQYLMSHQCVDWRYSRARQPFTIVYTVKVNRFVASDIEPMDDIDEIVIVPLNEVQNYLKSTDSHLLYINKYKELCQQ